LSNFSGGARLARMNLSELTTGRNNNLDALRLIAALTVVYTHSLSILSMKEVVLPFYNAGLGSFAVHVFFIISGFLITQSCQRQTPLNFLKARALRIFPALIAVVVISAFVVGPLVTNLPLGEYFTNGQTYRYLINATLVQYVNSLPGVFDNGVVNGSLWTLRYEFLCYILVLLVGLIGALKNRKIALGLFILSAVLDYMHFGNDSAKWLTGSIQTFFWLFTFFSAGMVAYLYREYIVLSFKAFLFVVSLLVIATLRIGFPDMLMCLLLTYMVLFVGYYPRLKMGWLTRFGDFSYGIYVWGAIALDLLVNFYGRSIPQLLLYVAAACFSYVIAALSWHLLEKRALSLKSKTFNFAFLKAVRKPAPVPPPP
jgi:peptidoglycan/LPS O-acetylase OafA/YrhL